MQYLFESWCAAGENWQSSTVMTNIRSTSGSVRRGVKKWLCKAELIRPFGEDVANAIIAHKMSCKTLMKNEIRDHPDAPGCEAGIAVPFCSYSACKPRASTCYTCAMSRARLRDNTGSWIMNL